jgi:uncharacterized protein YcfJ
MTPFTKHAIALALTAFATQAAAQVTVYEREGFEGRSYTTSSFRTEPSINVSSLIVRDNNLWEACDDTGFRGFCTRLMPGQYPSIASMGHRNPIASLRIAQSAPPEPRAEYRDERREDRREERRDFRRRSGERIYEVPVANVRAIVGAPEQRCWVEREQVSANRPNVGGAIAGALLGGIIGHQVGSGRNQDLATAGGAVAGGAIGSQVGRGGPAYQDVQRCTTVSNQTPAYYDVTYYFRGEEHRIQMSTPPGSTITVNENGEPRA